MSQAYLVRALLRPSRACLALRVRSLLCGLLARA